MSDKRLPKLGDKVIYRYGPHEEKHNGAAECVGFVARAWGGEKRMANIHVLPDCAPSTTYGSRYHADDADPSWQGGVWRFADEV